MSTEGREQRVSVKTSKMVEYEAGRAKTKEVSTNIKRTKHIRAEEGHEDNAAQGASKKK
ncbi:hypothetical protein FRC07_011885, partial [Ceratobasidium sp. 392]